MLSETGASVSASAAAPEAPAQPPRADLAALAERPWSFHFYRALRLLEAMSPDRPRIGRSTRPADDPIRFGQEPALGFRSSMIAGFEPGSTDRPARLDVNFFGLFGPEGPLPIHITALAVRREADNKDRALREFFNLFTHRMLQYFYRAWSDAQPVAQLDRPADDGFGLHLRQLTGAIAADSADLPPEVQLYWAGLFGTPSRPAEGLERILTGFLGAPVCVESWCGRWLALDREERTRLGGASTALGSAVVGERVWEVAGQFRLVVGPLPIGRYEALLPGGRSLPRLVAITRAWTGGELGWDLRLILRREDVPPLRLGDSARLGWTSWVSSTPASADAGDCVLDPELQPRVT